MSDQHPNALLSQLIEARRAGRTELALLLDPDRTPVHRLRPSLRAATRAGVHYILVGSSLLIDDHLNAYLRSVRSMTRLPLILFPGNAMHVSPEADGILFLSLISGRNPELLIGQHVQAAQRIHKSGLEVLPTGYMLIEGGRATSVSYMSQSLPIPNDKPEIALSTALAGQMLGLRLLYLEAGSGAQRTVPESLVRLLHKELPLPLIVGGGIREPRQAAALARAGASLLVVGTAAEREPERLSALVNATQIASLNNP